MLLAQLGCWVLVQRVPSRFLSRRWPGACRRHHHLLEAGFRLLAHVVPPADHDESKGDKSNAQASDEGGTVTPGHLHREVRRDFEQLRGRRRRWQRGRRRRRRGRGRWWRRRRRRRLWVGAHATRGGGADGPSPSSPARTVSTRAARPAAASFWTRGEVQRAADAPRSPPTCNRRRDRPPVFAKGGTSAGAETAGSARLGRRRFGRAGGGGAKRDSGHALDGPAAAVSRL